MSSKTVSSPLQVVSSVSARTRIDYDPEAEFVRTGAIGLVEEVLVEAELIGSPPSGSGRRPSPKTPPAWRATILHVFERTTNYPFVSGVVRELHPEGIRLRVRPDARSHTIFTVRLTNPGCQDYDAAATRLRVAAEALFRQAMDVSTVPVDAAVTAAVTRAVSELYNLAFTSNDPAVWLRAITTAVGRPAEVVQAAIANAEDLGQITWSSGSGYASPVQVNELPSPVVVPVAVAPEPSLLPPVIVVQPLPAPVVQTPPVAPIPPPVVTQPLPVVVSGPTDQPVSELEEMIQTLQRLDGVRTAYAAATTEITERRRAVAAAALAVAGAEETLRTCRMELDGERHALTLAEERQLSFVGSVFSANDADVLIRLAATVERHHKPTTPTAG